MRGICDGLAEYRIATRSADIFRRTTSVDFDKTRVENIRGGIKDVFDRNSVLPTVTEIVKIGEYVGIGEKVPELRILCVKATGVTVGIDEAPGKVTSDNLVKMTIAPSHRCLQQQMQFIQSGRERNLNASHDSGLNVFKNHFEMCNARIVHI